MSTILRVLFFRLILVLAGLSALGFSAHAEGLQTVTETASQYAASIEDQYGSSDDPAAQAADLAQAGIAMARGDVYAAVKAYEQAIAAGDKSAATWTALANAQTRRSDYGSAEGAAYNAYSAAESPEDKAAALAKLGRILEKAEEPTTALEAYHESLKLAFDRGVKDHSDTLEESLRFRVIAKSTAAAGDRPEICLEFYGSLPAASDVHYEDYIKVSPSPAEAAFSVSDTKLCIGGVEFDIAHAGIVRPLAGHLNRRPVIVVANEMRFGKRLGHKDGTCAVSATDIGGACPAFELCDHAVQCRQP